MNDAIVMMEGPDQRAAEIDAFKAEFLRYAAMPDLSQPCPVGRLIGDRGRVGLAREPIWHVVGDAMVDKADFTRRAMELLCGLAQSRYEPAKAAALLSDMAEHWAELRCDL
jgi:hypothetical protein